MPAKRISRRTFLGSTAASVAALATIHIVPRHVLGGPRHVPPSEKLNIAGIGVGGMGGSNLRQMESQNIVALCDVDSVYAAKTFKRYPQAVVYSDYRQMLEKQKDIDAVLIATPDHTHAVISIAALRAGKHVYCQKPLTHDIYEARTLAKAAQEAGVVTVMGIQGHSGEGNRLIAEWIADGAIGEVREVDAWCNLSYAPWGHAWWSPKCGTRPTETPAVPSTLNWDLWLGPAKQRPYHPCYHPAVWRAWWDFGNGMMGDRGVHTLDGAFGALNLGAPTVIEATTKGGNEETHPLSCIVTFQFPARGQRPPVKVTWYDGQNAPRPEELEKDRMMGEKEGGIIFKGDKGKIMAGIYGAGPRIIPESKMKEYKRPAKTLPRITTSHEMNWIECCKAGRQPGANFEYAAALSEICCLGNIAKKIGGRIEWDSAAMKVTNNDQANRFVRWDYRKGWSL